MAHSAYLTKSSDDDLAVPAGTRWLVRQMTLRDGSPSITPCMLAFADHFTTRDAKSTLLLRLSFITEYGSPANLPDHCKGTWRVFDLNTFKARDFDVFTGPPVDVRNVLHVAEIG